MTPTAGPSHIPHVLLHIDDANMASPHWPNCSMTGQIRPTSSHAENVLVSQLVERERERERERGGEREGRRERER